MFTTVLLFLNTIFIGSIIAAAYYAYTKYQSLGFKNIMKMFNPSIMSDPVSTGGCCPPSNPYAQSMTRPINSFDDPTTKKSFDETHAEYETEHDCKLIIINHDISSGGFASILGGGVSNTLTMDNAVKVMKALQVYDGKTVHLVINTLGGSVSAAQVIIKAMSHYDTTVFIPYYAMSAGTMIALHANKIHLGKHAFMGPTDPQINGLPARSILDFVPSESASFLGDGIRLIQGYAKRTEDELCDMLKARFVDATNTEEILDVFARGKYTHGTPFTYEFVSQYITIVENGIPESMQSLMSAYAKKDRMPIAMPFDH